MVEAAKAESLEVKTTEAIPYRLAFADEGGFTIKGHRFSHGDAGYTVAHVPKADALTFALNLPRQAWMPGTERFLRAAGMVKAFEQLAVRS